MKWRKKPPAYSTEETGWDESIFKGQIEFGCYTFCSFRMVSGSIGWAVSEFLRWVCVWTYSHTTKKRKTQTQPWSGSSNLQVVSGCSSKWRTDLTRWKFCGALPSILQCSGLCGWVGSPASFCKSRLFSSLWAEVNELFLFSFVLSVASPQFWALQECRLV